MARYSFTKYTVILLVILFPLMAESSPPARVYTYTDGSTIEAVEVTSNEDALFNYLNRGVDTYADSTITTNDILDGTITTSDISGTAAIPYTKLLFSDNIDSGDLAADSVDTSEIATGAVATAEIKDDTITNADISVSAGIANSKLATITEAGKVNTSSIIGTLGTGYGGTGATAAANAANGVVVPTGAINAANGAVVPTGAVNAANGAVILNASSQLPAVSGALITNLPTYNYSGATVYSGVGDTNYADLDLSATVGTNRALVFLKITNNDVRIISVRPNGDSTTSGSSGDGGCSTGQLDAANSVFLITQTDASGIIEWKTSSAVGTHTIVLVCFIK